MTDHQENSPTSEELTEKLTSYILSDVLLDSSQTELEPDDDLLEDGLVDSLGVMRLIAFIETSFGYTVPPEDVTVDSFMSVSAIVAYLQENLPAES